MSSLGRRKGSVDSGGSPSRVRVAVRVRPPTSKVGDAATARCIEEEIDPDGERLPKVHFRHENVRKAFAFDHVFPSCASQEDVYAASLRPFLSPFLNGFNVTVIAYGQTGAGKTFTVGHHASLSPCPSPDTPRGGDKIVRIADTDDGLIPRFLIDLFEALRGEPSVKTIHVSFLEIYCDEIHDLLSNARTGAGVTHGRSGKSGSMSKERPLAIRDDDHRATVQSLTQIQVETVAKALELMNIGRARQATGSNALNSQSSRSHAIYTVEVSRKFAHDIKNTKLTFVDLAGSERLQKTHVQGMRMKESIQINVGLLALSTVINALKGDRLQKRRQSMDSSGMNGDTVSHVPYRSSKLTRLLRDALGGNSMSLFIACVSPTATNSSETLGTLKFADSVSCIENKAQKNVEAVDASDSSSPQCVSSPRSSVSSPLSSTRRRSASEAEISRLQEQILMLKHQLDMARADPVEPPVKCTTYERVAPATASVQLKVSKLTPPKVPGLSKSPASREPESTVVTAKKASTDKPPAQGSNCNVWKQRSVSTSELRRKEAPREGKVGEVKASKLALPRIYSGDQRSPRDTTPLRSISSESVNAPAKSVQSSGAIKQLIKQWNCAATPPAEESTSPVTFSPTKSTARCSRKSELRCIDQQTANDSSVDEGQSASDDSADDAASPSKEDDSQPQSADSQTSLEPEMQTLPTRIRQSSSQACHGRRRSSPSILAIPQNVTRLQSFLEAIKLPTNLSPRERSDSRFASPSQSPRSSPSSPSSASTSSVSPMSVKGQSLASPVEPASSMPNAIVSISTTSDSTAKSALAAFLEKVKPNGYVSTKIGSRSSYHQCEDKVSETELADGGIDTCNRLEHESNLELKEALGVKNVGVSHMDDGQFEQEGSPARSQRSRQQQTDDLLLCERDQGIHRDKSSPEMLLSAAPSQPNASDVQHMTAELPAEDVPDEAESVNFQLPLTKDQDATASVGGCRVEDPAATSLRQIDVADDEQQSVSPAETADDLLHYNVSQIPATRAVTNFADANCEFDPKSSELSVVSGDTHDNNSVGSSQACNVPSALSTASASDVLAPVKAALASHLRYYGPIYPADPLDFEDFLFPTADQSTQCDMIPPPSTPEREQAQKPLSLSSTPVDFVVHRRHWRDDVRRHFTDPDRRHITSVCRRKARDSSRVHPFKWFSLPESRGDTRGFKSRRNDDSELNDDEALRLTATRRATQLLGEMQQIIRSEIGDHASHTRGGSLEHTDSLLASSSDDTDDTGKATDTLQGLLDGMTRLLDARAQCQQRVDTLKRQRRHIARMLGSQYSPKQMRLGSLDALGSIRTALSVTDEELGQFTLGHQEALLRAALADSKTQVAARIEQRVRHFQQAVTAIDAAPPSDVFLSRDQYAACRSSRGLDLLHLAISGSISVSRADIDAEAAWLSL